LSPTRLKRRARKSTARHRAVILACSAALLVAFSAVFIVVGSAPGGATLVSSDGITTLAPLGTVTPGPYTSGQAIAITGTANSTLSNANLVANAVPGQTTGDPTGSFFFEECTDVGGTTAGLPTTSSGCEAATDDFTSVQKSSDGSFDDPSYPVYDLPDLGTLGNATMVGKCDVAPNTCVIGIFAENPGTTGFTYPHLFSAPFNIEVGDGQDLGDNPGDGTAPTAATTSAANSTVTASPATVTADGVNTSQVTVSLMDTNDHPVNTPKSVTLSQGTGHSTIEVNGAAGSTATTSGGQVVFTVSDTTAESVTYTATDTTDGNLVVSESPTATVNFSQPVVSPAKSTIAAGNTAVPNGGNTTITVTLKDQGAAPQPIAGKVITLNQGSASSTIAPASTGSNTTNQNGQATFTVSDSTGESVTYTATDTTDNNLVLSGLSISVTFGTLAVSASQSMVMPSSPTVATAGSAVSQNSGTIDVTLLDGSTPFSGKVVTLTGSPSSSVVITPSSQMTGSDGVASFAVSDPNAENVTFSAVDTSDNITLTKTAQVSFQLPAASPTTSGITATPAAVPADGVSAAGITVTMDDQFGNPLANKTVTVSGVVTGTPNPSTTANIVPSQASNATVITTTNGSGEITFDSNDTTAESITYTATDTTDSVTLTQTATVVFDATATQVSQSSVQANPSSVPADGTTASTVTVALEDHNKNPVSGITVGLTALNGSSAISPASGVATNSAGVATFEVTDTTSEVVRYRATDLTDGLPLVGEEVQITFGSPPPTVPSQADSDIVASSTTVPADGISNATVDVVLSDANGLPLSGKTVSLVPMSVYASESPTTATTDPTGTATFTVTDKVAESVTFTATDLTDNMPLNGLSVTISFTPVTRGAATATTATLNKPIVAMASTPDGNGYWLAASDGGVFSEGSDTGFYGSAGSLQLNKPIVGMAATPDGKGYWLVASDGGIFNYGDAGFYGSAGSIQLNKPIVGMAATPDGKGYWLVASDGGIFNYGHAGFYGSTGSIQLNKPITAAAPAPDGKGYWLAASDGGIFNYGDAGYFGSLAG
jgi:Invasin, domain 3/Bacterial Ig-like domain (group 1)